MKQRIPDVMLDVMTPAGAKRVRSKDLFTKKAVVVFGMPGAFTPYCHNMHLPMLSSEYNTFVKEGAHVVACTAVNDIYVLTAWGRAAGVPPGLLFLGDGNGDFARGIGMLFDGSDWGIGQRSKRYEMWVLDGVIQDIQMRRDPLTSQVTSADLVPRVFTPVTGALPRLDNTKDSALDAA